MNNGTRILIVEDKSSDYELAQREIRKSIEFCEFERVETKESFLQALHAFQPDIILSDYNLPAFDGMKALQLAQQVSPFTPVVIWTGSISEDVAVECMRAGAANYVLKDNNKRLASAVLHALEEKKIMVERDQAQAELRTVTEDMTELICRFKPDGTLTYVNQVYCDYFGKRREELIGTSFINRGVADLTQKYDQYFKSLTPDRPISVFELYDLLPDGSKRWREWVDRGIFDEQGQLIEVQSTGRDVTDRKQAEARLVESEKHFRALIENGMDNISLLAADGTLLWENPAVNHTLGYGQNAYIDRNIFELMHPEDMAWTSELFTQVTQKPGNQQRGTFRLKHRDGTWRWIEATATNMLDEPSVQAVVINYRDITARKLAEEAMRENEQRYRTLFEDIPVAIWEEDFSELKKHLELLKQQGITDFAAYFESHPEAVIECASKITILDVNHAALQMYEATSKQVLIESTTLELTEGEKQHFPEDFIAIAEAKTSNSWEGPEETLLGNPIEVSTSWSVVSGHEDDYSKVIVTTMDITKSKQAEKHLRESQNKYRNLVETSHDLIWAVDAEGRFTFVNGAAKDIYGYEPEELIGRFYFDVMDPEHNHLTRETFKEAIASINEYHDSETYVQHRDGRRFVLSANSIVLRDETGHVMGVTGTSRDITEQKRAEESLRKERNLLRTLIDHIPDRIYAMDKQGRKTLSNIADWKASGGRTMEDVLGKTDFDLYPRELAEPFWELDKAVLDSGKPVINFEEPGLDPEGNMVSVLTTKIPLRDETGNTIGLVGIGRDITERKEMEGAESEQRALAEALRDTAQLLNSTLEYGEVLDHILAAVEKVVPHSAATIMLIEGEFARVVRSHGYEKLGVKDEILGIRLSVTNTDNLRQLLETGQPVVVYDTHAYAGWKRLEITDWLRSNVGAPISIQGEVIGFIMLDSDKPGFFTPLHAERLEAFANQAALAIHNARLLQKANEEIAERKQAEQELKLSHSLLYATLESTADGILVVDTNGKVTNFNQKFLELWRIPQNLAAERNDRVLLDFVVEQLKDPSAFVAKVEALYQSPVETYWDELEFVDGRVFERFSQPQRLGDSIVGRVWSFHDITERKQAEQALQQSQARYHDLFDNSPISLWEEDYSLVKNRIEGLRKKGITNFSHYLNNHPSEVTELASLVRIIDVNKASLELFHAGQKEDLLRDLTQILDSDVLVHFQEELLGLMGPSRGFTWEGSDRTFDGMPLNVIVTGTIPAGYEDDWSKVIISIVDITERKQAEVELQHKNEDLRLLNVVNNAIVRGQNLDSIVDLLTIELKRIFSAVGSTIYMLSADKRSLTMQQYSFSPEIEHKIEKLLGFKIPKIEIPVKEGGHFHNALMTKQSAITSDPRKIQEWITEFAETKALPSIARTAVYRLIPHIYKLLNIKSTIIVPLISHEEVIGFLDVSAPTQFTRNDLKRIEAIGEQLTSLIQRQQADEKVRKSEEFLQGIQNSLSAHIAILDKHGTVVQVNDAWRAFGDQNNLQSPNYCIGMNYLAVCESAAGPDTDSAHQIAVAIRQILTGDRDEASVEYSCHSPTEKRWFTVHITCFNDGAQKWVILAHENITERKHAEKELRDSEERFRQLADNIEEAFWITDAQTGQELYLSPAVEKIWGYPIQHFMEEPGAFFSSVLPEDRPILTHGIENERNGEKTELEYRIVHPDGSIRWVWDRAFPIIDENGKVTKLTGISTDITQRKAVEQELRKLSLAVEQSGSTIVITDLNGNIEYVNPKFVETTGYSSEEAIGNNPRILKTGRTPPTEYQRLWQTIKSGEVWRGELYNRKKNGQFYWEQATISPIHDEHGEISHFIAVKEDITERKQTEAALLASEERYRGLFKNLVNGFALHEIVTDEQGRPVDYIFLEVNPAFETLTGLKSDDVVGRRASEIMPGIENERFIPIYGQVALTGQPVHFEDYSSALGKYFEINAYSPHTNQFATTFGDITQRRHAEEELQRHIQKTDALLNASLALTNLDLDAILQSIGHSAKGIFSADGCRIFLMQPDGQSLRCVLALQENAGMLTNLKIKLGEGVTGSVALSGQAEIVNEMHRDSRAGYIPGTPEDEEEAIIFAPIKERDRILGVLSIRRAGTDRPFDTSDLELLEAFASMAASAVLNARLFEEAQQRLSELQALYENGLSVGRLLEPKEIGEHVIQTFARHLSWHHVTIRLVRPETDEMELIAFNIPGLHDEGKAEMERHFNRMVQKSGQGLSGSVLQSGIPLRTGNVHAYPQYVDTLAGIQSGLYMPLKIGQQVIGVISVESEEPDAFTEQDERLLATLANQAAIAFENARLYQAAQQEIIERRRAQEALWLSESHYRQLADSITDILFELDQDLCYTHWNKALEMFSGIPAQDAIGKSLQDVWDTSDALSTREDVYRSVLKERQAKTFESETITNGQKRILEINAYPSARGVSVVAKDITERRLSESLLQKRFELMEYATHHSLDELMQRTIDVVSEMTESHVGFLHFVEEDQKTVRLQAWSTETLRLKGVSHFPQESGMHYPVDTAGVWADAVRQRQSVIHNDYESLSNKKGLPEGHVPLVREMVIPILRNDMVVAVLGVGNRTQEYTVHDLETMERFADYAWDITERKQMETALAEERNQLAQRVEERTADLSRANSNLARALRVKDEFLANMSHELRTPLNAILGLSESLSEQVAGPLNEKQQKYLSTINESGHHLLSLINDILDLAKIEAGQITLDINKVDVNLVCQASVRMIKQLAQRKNQDVSFVIDADLGLMWADERRLKQMIVNLLSNAVKFTPESGTLGLEVRGDRLANRISISVWDRGIGISDRDLGRLFQPFVQLDAGLAREASGTGLGLALVAQMARLHGGSVTVESQQGQGSRFTILLPWEPAMAGDNSARLRSTGKFRAIKPDEVRPTILLIEDTQEVVMMLVDYLEMAGFRMVTAQDGIDGLTQAKLAHPDLILMDIQMPRMDGFETTKRLRSDPEFKETPIIALTALAMPNDRARCLDAGMNEYLSKPVNLKALAKTIKMFLYEAEAGSS